MDINSLVDSLMGEVRKKGDKVFGNRIYQDEPIISTGKRMRERNPAFVPEQIREMRRLASRSGSYGYMAHGGRLFYEQGKLMESYDDDCPFSGDFIKYYPTYQDFPDPVLRGYFTWRTRYREGDAAPAPLSFLFLHAYEILCGIGVEPGACGYEKLARFARDYAAAPWPFPSYLEEWGRDYAIYHGLDTALLGESLDAQPLYGDIDLMKLVDDAVAESGTGRWPQSRDMPPQDDFFEALCRASTYRMEKSAVLKDHRRAAVESSCAAFARMSLHCARRRKVGFVDGMFGSAATVPYSPFSRAVFYDPEPHRETRYEVPGGDAYLCHGAYWTKTVKYSKAVKNASLGDLLHAVDAHLRSHYAETPPLKPRRYPKYLDKIAEEEAARIVQRIAEEEAARVIIDRTALEGIRVSAAATREALLVDEEREDVPADPAPPERVVAEAPAPAPDTHCGAPDASGPETAGALMDCIGEAERAGGDATAAAMGLDPLQSSILGMLASGGFDRAALPTDCSVDMAVDAINEAFFEIVGDTVVEFVDGVPVLVEDYREEVLEALQ